MLSMIRPPFANKKPLQVLHHAGGAALGSRIAQGDRNNIALAMMYFCPNFENAPRGRKLDLPDIIRAVGRKPPTKLRQNMLVGIWGRTYLVRIAPKKPLEAAIQTMFLVPDGKPAWAQGYFGKSFIAPGPRRLRPTWCTERAWATAKKREQRGATITDPMLVEIMEEQAAKRKGIAVHRRHLRRRSA